MLNINIAQVANNYLWETSYLHSNAILGLSSCRAGVDCRGMFVSKEIYLIEFGIFIKFCALVY